MMNTNWSEKVQSIYCLDSSRELRFTEDKLNEIIKATRIEASTNVLEIGCGTGVFTRKLAKFLSEATSITGLDMDNKFIEYCKEIAMKEGLYNIKYVEGNALSLPFADNTFDACTSHTVIEHVPNKEFLEEQYRVCKKGGCVSVMNVRPELAMASQNNIAQSERESELLAKISSVTKKQKMN